MWGRFNLTATAESIVEHCYSLRRQKNQFSYDITPAQKIIANDKPKNIFRILVFMLLFSILLSPIVKAAEIGLSRKELTGSTSPLTVVAIIISGQIEKGDAKKVENLVFELKRTNDAHQIRRLLINSPGGLAGEAMEIGKLIRANGFEVFIPKELSCISACVLVLAGGVTRTIVGQVGIDHPHFLREAGANDNVQALLIEMKTIMRYYFLAMGVREELAEAMFALPEGVVHYLSQDELIHYQLTPLGKPGS